jgi:hypothetical protein
MYTSKCVIDNARKRRISKGQSFNRFVNGNYTIEEYLV